MRSLQKCFFWLVSLAAVMASLAIITFFFAPASLVASQVDALARTQLGRGLSFAAAENRRLYPSLGADFVEVTLENADWAGPGPLLKAKRVSIDFDTAALLRGAWRVSALHVDAPELLAVISREGQTNWRLGAGPRPQNAMEQIAATERAARAIGREIARRIADPAATAFPPKLTRITDGRIRIDNRLSGRGSELTGFNLTARQDRRGAIALEGAALVNGAPTTLTARLPDPFALFAGRAESASILFVGDGLRFALDGDVDLRPDSLSVDAALSGALSADKTRTAWFRRALPRSLDELGETALQGTLQAGRDRLDLRLSSTGVFNGQALTGSLTATGGRDWRRGRPIAANLSVAAGALASAEATGELTLRADAFQAFTAKASAISADWSRVRLWAGVTPPRRPVGSIRLDAALRVDRAGLLLSDAALTVEEAPARIALSLDWSRETLQIDGELSEGPLNLLAFAPGKPSPRRRLAASNGEEVGAGDAEAPLAGAGEIAELAPREQWSTTPLPVHLLDQARGAFRVGLKGAELGAISLGPTDLNLKLGAGDVTLKVKKIALYDGKLSGSARLTRQGEGARFDARLALEGVQSGKLLAATGRANWLRGPAMAELSASGAGDSMAQLMGSLSGGGKLEMRNGALLAINFAAASLDRRLALFAARQPDVGVTPFTRARLPFRIEKGVARSDDFSFEGDVVRAKGEGVVDIGARRVDFTVTPTGFGRIPFLGVDSAIARAFPVRLLGPWSAVRVFLDRSKAADTRVNREE